VGTPTVVHGADRDRRPGRSGTVPLAGWAAAGTLGSLGMVLTGSRIGAVANPAHPLWWFSVPNGGSPFTSVTFYLSMAVLVAAWLGTGLQAMAGRLTVQWAWLLLALWGLPLFFGPPLFSRDIYSYIAQGVIAHRGLDPYTVGPSVLGPGPLLSSVATVWRHTSSPYGPLFVAATRVLAALSGRSLVAAILAFRALELVGVALIMVSLPRLARHLGTSVGTALWLGALSPLALFSFVSSGHNDALMVGLLAAGVALSVEGRLLVGLALCALAATIKLPAAVAIVFLAADHLRAGRWRDVALPLAAAATVFVGVSVATGYGFAWLGPAALHVPTELRVLPTPSVALGDFFFHLVRLVGGGATESATVTVTQTVCGIGALLGCLWLVLTVHRHEVVRSTGLALVLIVVGSPTVWPWYLMWGGVLLAATTAQRSRVLAGVAALAMVVVGPTGSPRFNGTWYLAVTLVIAGSVAWLIRGRHWRSVVTGLAG
jgi:hypothetical protein